MDDVGGILTVGHSSRDLDDFLALLKAHGVALIADVRKMPGSRRHPHFDREALAVALSGAGIDYRHFPGLGGLRRPVAESANAGWRNRSFQGFADYMQTESFGRALDELIAAAGGRRVAIMCAEAVPWRCHRSLIADALVARGIGVGNILGPGRLAAHEIRPWAKVSAGRVTYPPSPGAAALPLGD
jgi:uncharacterized protein (DUF488 family)